MSVQKERMNGDISSPILIPFAERSRKVCLWQVDCGWFKLFLFDC